MSTFGFCMIGLLAGIAIGSTLGICYYRRSLKRTLELEVVRNITIRLHTLTRLREGDLEAAIKHNEDKLEGSISLLGAMLRKLPKERRREHQYALEQIRAAKTYREKYPHKSRLEHVDRNIAEYLTYGD